MAQAGDKVIIINYGTLDEAEIAAHKPTIIMVDEANKVIKH